MLAPTLRHLDFASESGELVSGLVPIKEGEESLKRLDERLAVRDAIAVGDVDYVFFRRFADDRSSQLVAYIVDNADSHLTEPALAELHKRVWLHGGVPLIYVAWASRVDVLTCARGPDFWGAGKCQYNPAEQIRKAVERTAEVSVALRAKYSAWRLLDGTFWDDPANASLADGGQRAHERLIQAVVETDKALGGGEDPLLRRLLLLTVLIKYLEDRRVFPAEWFSGFSPGARSFFEVLRDGEPSETVRLLAELEKRFNGDIFALPGGAENRMTKSVLRAFAKLVEAKTINQQHYLWEQFSFEHIPVEVVSHLYQRFVKGGHGTVYTPPFLASLLLDHAMPYGELTGGERILDPACGSGVFLVGAFRRLVAVHRAKNGWRALDVAALKVILTRSVFGIELDPGAVDLAAFSLALAICDVLKPEVIWGELKFDQLRNRNLLEGDFFAEVRKGRDGQSNVCMEKFDVILGNPPFESELTAHGEALNREVAGVRGELPDKQAAYLFLEQGIGQLKPGGRLCLIQPSGILYNAKAATFRRRIIESANVEMVLDFTSIRSLYEAADPKTVAFLVTGAGPREHHNISHLTFRRTFGTRQRIAFEVDHYDWHSVPQEVALNDDFVWRINLLGGGRLIALSRRLRKLDTLRRFTKRKKLRYGEGYIVGNRKYERPFLTGMKFLPADALTDDGIDYGRLGKVTETHFEGPREESLYQAPLVLIRKNERLQLGFWDGGPLAFTSTVVSIGLGDATRDLLNLVHSQLKEHHRTYRLSCMMHGSKAFVAKATAILKQDIDKLPFPEDASELELSFWEKALEDDTLDFFSEFVRLGQNSVLLTQRAEKKDVQGYSDLFCKMLNAVYKNLKADTPVFLAGLICQPFYFGDRPKGSWPAEGYGEVLRDLIYHEHHESLRTVRLLRFYVDNVMLIVKPDRLRFWIRSTAIRDADETVLSLMQQGY